MRMSATRDIPHSCPDIDTVLEMVEGAKRDIENIKELIEGLYRDIDLIPSRMEDIRGINRDLRAAADETGKERDALEDQVDDLSEEIEDLKSRVEWHEKGQIG